MSDNIKLIIEIDKDRYTDILRIADVQIVRRMPTLEQVVAQGIPLDDDSERAEVQAYFAGQTYGWEEGRKALIDDVKAEIDDEWANTYDVYSEYANGLLCARQIIDNCIGKTESEVKPNE